MRKSFLTAILITIPLAASAAAPFELQQAIQEKSKALQAITQKIQENQRNLSETADRSKTLKQELQRITYAMNQLDLGIKSSEITIEKLNLEIDSLQYDIASAENQSHLKKETIRELLRVLREKDDENELLILLKHRAFSDSFLEIQNLTNFNGSLRDEVVALNLIAGELTDKLSARSEKLKQVEVEQKSLKIKKSSIEEQKNDRQQLLSRTKNQEKLYQLAINDLEKKQSDISIEIESIEQELRSKIDPNLLPTRRPGVLAMPTIGILSQNFGATAFARLGGYKGHFHNGIDIAAPIGTAVYAAEDGRVLKTGDQDKFCRKGAYGRYIVIAHGNNLTTLYAHLSYIGVNIGEEVKRGDVIGYVGKTGYATGPHLHFTVYSGPTFYIGPSHSCGDMPYGGVLNPLDYL